ncbi:MAG: adenylosuccinate lyase [Methanocellales archaeon]
MAIHPIEFRYGTKEMKKIWEEETKLQKLLDVEVAIARAQADAGFFEKNIAEEIEQAAKKVKLDRVKEIESEIHHDIMAVVQALVEQCPPEAGRWVHFGATSNDILDTALALQLREALAILERKLKDLLAILMKQASIHKYTVCVGRTHGQIATPTTYGLRFAIWCAEVSRHLERLRELKPRLLVGKMGGAVGTQAPLGKRGIEVQRRMLHYLGLGSVDVCSQIVQRDRHAEYIMYLANLATTLDKIALEIRSLQRSEIAEVEEGIGKRQVGSSTMPHKRNPIRCEQICGLARVIRSYVEPALQNNLLWDERDLTNSSCERVIIPEATILTDHILKLASDVIEGLTFYPENIRKNLELMKGLNMSEAVMIELTKRGMARQEAHELLRAASNRAFLERRHLKEVIREERAVLRYIKEEELEELLKPENYIGTAVEQVENLISKLKRQFEIAI